MEKIYEVVKGDAPTTEKGLVKIIEKLMSETRYDRISFDECEFWTYIGEEEVDGIKSFIFTVFSVNDSADFDKHPLRFFKNKNRRGKIEVGKFRSAFGSEMFFDPERILKEQKLMLKLYNQELCKSGFYLVTPDFISTFCARLGLKTTGMKTPSFIRDMFLAKTILEQIEESASKGTAGKTMYILSRGSNNNHRLLYAAFSERNYMFQQQGLIDAYRKAKEAYPNLYVAWYRVDRGHTYINLLLRDTRKRYLNNIEAGIQISTSDIGDSSLTVRTILQTGKLSWTYVGNPCTHGHRLPYLAIGNDEERGLSDDMMKLLEKISEIYNHIQKIKGEKIPLYTIEKLIKDANLQRTLADKIRNGIESVTNSKKKKYSHIELKDLLLVIFTCCYDELRFSSLELARKQIGNFFEVSVNNVNSTSD